MKVLFVSASNPYSHSSGADLRLRAFLEGVVGRYETHLLCLADRARIEEPGPGGSARLEEARFNGSSRMIRLWRSLTLRMPDLAFRSRSRGIAVAVHRRMLLDEFAAVHISGLQMAYLSDVFWATVEAECVRPALIFDDLNAEHVVHQRMSAVESGRGRWLHAAYSLAQTRLLRDYEAEIVGGVDTVICPTSEDRELLQDLDASAQIEVVPSGLDTSGYGEVPPPPERPVAVFVGDQTYRPNRQAVDWLTSKIAPAVWKMVPETEFLVVGRGYRPSAATNGTGSFRYAGHVDDVISVLATSKVVLAPLLAGGGMKLKVLEGMAAGRPVVATSVGAAGIDAHGDRELLIADGTEAYAQALVSVLTSTDRARQIGDAARRRVKAQYDSSIVGSRYVEILERTIKRVGA